ncbi:bacteriorhodopsin [Spirosoma sp. SC4-14]|uniref:bacteriorhodopsin n=1 Tax=Spirosoma sp. SC4-14 TaxID=3128900 RepID=UPI0030D59CB3
MKLSDTFLPTAGIVGLLPMVTYFLLLVTLYAFLANFLFALLARETIRPEYRRTHSLTVSISAIAGFSYFLIQGYYHDMLTELATLTDPDNRQILIRESYSAIGQYRYMDWAVTTPLLLIQTVSILGVRLSTLRRPLTVMLLADFFMILAGYIGEQQLGFDNEILTGPKLIWGAVAALAYVLIPITLYRLWKEVSGQSRPEERHAFRLMALATVTGWGVYPIGYILTTTSLDLNWIHVAFSLADIANKIGVGLLVYQTARQLEKP